MNQNWEYSKKGVLDNMMLIRIESSAFMLYAVLILMFLVLTIIVKKRSDVASGGSYVALNQLEVYSPPDLWQCYNVVFG